MRLIPSTLRRADERHDVDDYDDDHEPTRLTATVCASRRQSIMPSTVWQSDQIRGWTDRNTNSDTGSPSGSRSMLGRSESTAPPAERAPSVDPFAGRVRVGRGRYCQLLSWHAATGPYLKDKTYKTENDRRWWCGGGKKQARHRPFTECRVWRPQIARLWRDVGEACR